MNNQIQSDVANKQQEEVKAKIDPTVEYTINNGDSEKGFYDQVNVRLPVDLNDWLNLVVRQTKRLHGSKIPKEMIIEAALQHLRHQDLDWTQIKNKDDLLKALID